MRVLLMHPEADFDHGQAMPANEEDLMQDLELQVLFSAMALGDKFMDSVAHVAILSSGGNDLTTIGYRQAVLRDCLRQPDFIRELYALTIEGIDTERREWSWVHDSSHSILTRSVKVMTNFVDVLRRLRQLFERHEADFESHGMLRLSQTIRAELTEEYLAQVQAQTEKLRLAQGVLMTAHLGAGNRGRDYVLRETARLSWLDRVLPTRRSGLTFQIAPRDEAGAKAVAELSDRGVNLAANALGQAVEHIVSFFKQLATELAFYIGCLNLHERLSAKNEPLTIPTATATEPHTLIAEGVYDVCLSLSIDGHVVGNRLSADGDSLIFITGANRGGKSTFLRSVGLAQLMMQAGMFVGAETFQANLRDGVFTHYKREEDSTMSSGKLVEELQRMSRLVEYMTPQSLLLCNESFASTNEFEASAIGGHVITALTEVGAKLVFVTHLYDLGHRLYESARNSTLFLRAEPNADGSPTFKLIEGQPLPTSHGEQIYQRIFEDEEPLSIPA